MPSKELSVLGANDKNEIFRKQSMIFWLAFLHISFKCNFMLDFIY